jgi:predicted permease
VDPGFAMQNVATVSWDLASIGLGHAQASEFNTAILDRVRTAPRVSAAVLASGSPLGSRHFGSMFAASRTAPAQGLFYLEVSPGFFSLLDIPLLRGRDFTSGEIASNIREVIVSDSLARSFWPGEDPLGKFLHVASPSADLQVIGVAKDAEVSELGAADHRFVYLPPDPADAWLMQTVLVRYEGDYSAAAATLRNAGRSFNSSLKVDVAPLEENLAPYRAISRLTAGAAGTLAIVALGLAIIGLYGTVAYGVSRRTREIGLRIALGAERGHVLRLLISQAMRPVIIGALVGIALCASISRILSGILFGVSPHDAITFAGVPLLLAGIALLAAYLPAQRALRVDPVVALREN